MKTILLLSTISMTLVAGNFTRMNDTVHDTAAKLQWQDDNASLKSRHNWQSATAYCEQLQLDGHDDWRLPSIEELSSIVPPKKVMPSIDKTFQRVKTAFYWSSTTDPEDENLAYAIHFSMGNKGSDFKYDEYKVRCVRTLP